MNVLRGLWVIDIVVDAEDLYPFAIVEVSMTIRKGTVEELVDLGDGEWGRGGYLERHLLLVHALANVGEPLAHLVDLDEARVCLVEALECILEVGLWVELEEPLAHHGEEHGEVDAGVCGVGGGCAGACVEEAVEHGLGGGYACGG